MKRVAAILIAVTFLSWLLSGPAFGQSGVFAVLDPNLPPDDDWSWDVALGDVDGDRDLDIIFANHGQNLLYVSDSSGAFADVTSAGFPGNSNLSWGVALGDVDGDGDLDAVFADTSQNELYLNNGSGLFADVTLTNLPQDDDDSRGVALGDVDGDGALDVVFVNRLSRNRLYINDGSGVFEDATAVFLPTHDDWSLDVALGDVDGDRDLDMVVANFNEQNKLYLNDGSGLFEEVTSTHLPVDSDSSLGIVLGDSDGDGDLDIVVANFGDNRLYTSKGRPSVPFGLAGCGVRP